MFWPRFGEKYVIKLAYLVTAILFSFPQISSAKRISPIEVNPIYFQGAVYITVPWATDNGTKQNGGYIRALDESKNVTLWGMQVYKTNYEDLKEKDIQDVFISKIKIDKKGKSLIIENELGEIFIISLKTKEVVKVKHIK